MKKYLDLVISDVETLIINRGKDRAVVVISLDEYNSLKDALQSKHISEAAESLAEEYENNKELTVFTSLDFEDFYETR